METVAEKCDVKKQPAREPVYLKNSDEVGEYLAKHLTPVRWGPKGQPIYALADIESLNIKLPDDV